MDYFEFFELPLSLSVDESLLKQRFYENSKRFHPDFFTLDDVEKQMEALEKSTLNNTAYKILSNFEKRLHYLLTLKGIMKEEGKNDIPQAFLMEMMEVNEAVMELQFDFDAEQFKKILSELEQTKGQLRQEIKEIIPKKDDEFTDGDFDKLKAFYLKNKYLQRLEDNIKKLEP